jgi:nicotinamidase-related amidase
VLATVLDAVDIGYRVIVVRDAVCSSSDEGCEFRSNPAGDSDLMSATVPI